MHFKVKYLHFLVSNFKLAGDSLKQNKPRVRSYQKNVIFHREKKNNSFYIFQVLIQTIMLQSWAQFVRNKYFTRKTRFLRQV